MSKKPLTGEQIFSLMSDIDPKLLAEAVPPSWVSDEAHRPQKEKKHPFAWLDSGLAAAILSTVVAIGVLIAIVMAGRMGTSDPVGGTVVESESGSETTPPAESEAYTIEYFSNRDGTCIAIIHPNDSTASVFEGYEVVIPETSPAGERVVNVENNFNRHMLLPAALLAEDFEQFIQAPMEAYFGITLAEAEAIAMDSKHPLHEQAFELRRHLAFYSFRPADSMGEETLAEGLRPADCDLYLLESTMKDDEMRAMHDLLCRIGLTADRAQKMQDRLVQRLSTGDCGIYVPPYVPSWGIRTVILPATLRSFPVEMFDEWIDLEKIIYGGTVDEWVALTGGEWQCLVRVECSDGIIRAEWDAETAPETYPQPDVEPVLSMATIAVDVPGRKSIYVQGMIASCDYIEDGERIAWDTSILWIGDYVGAQGVVLSTITIPQNSTASIRYLPRDGWEYSFPVKVYDEAFTDSTTHTPASTDDFAFLSDRPAGVYYVELWVNGNTPLTEEAQENDTYEYASTRYIFRLVVTDESPATDIAPLSVKTPDTDSVNLPGYIHWQNTRLPLAHGKAQRGLPIGFLSR